MDKSIEIQRSDTGANVKRARYNSSLLDANVTEAGDDFKDLAETYVIFIMENDVLEAGLPIYHIDRTILETGRAFEDKSHIIYVNPQIEDETELGRLMHDFSCTDAKNMYYKILADRVRYFKEDEKGVENMCRALEEMREQERLETKYEYVLLFPSGNLKLQHLDARKESGKRRHFAYNFLALCSIMVSRLSIIVFFWSK